MSIVQQVNSLCTVGYMSVYVRGIGQIGSVRGTVIERLPKQQLTWETICPASGTSITLLRSNDILMRGVHC